MNLRRLSYFLAVVDAGTVTAASEQLHIAQPALSRQIKTLEQELKIALFEPRGNRLALTPAGRAFVPAARRLMLESRGLMETAAALRTGRVETLVAASTAASVRGFLAPFIATTGPEDPLIITRETSHFDMSSSLEQGCDFAVSPAAPEGGLRTLTLGSISLKAYVSAGHEWARQGIRELPIASLKGHTVILPSHHSVSRHILDEELNRQHLGLSEVFECDDGQTIMALATAGRGIGISTDMPLYGAHPVTILSGDGSAGTPLSLPLHVAWLPGHFADETIRGIAKRLRGFLARQEAVAPPA